MLSTLAVLQSATQQLTVIEIVIHNARDLYLHCTLHMYVLQVAFFIHSHLLPTRLPVFYGAWSSNVVDSAISAVQLSCSDASLLLRLSLIIPTLQRTCSIDRRVTIHCIAANSSTPSRISQRIRLDCKEVRLKIKSSVETTHLQCSGRAKQS